MAKIVLSDKAPDDPTLRFSLGSADPFEAPYETDDPELIGNALTHPWLVVEQDEVQEGDEPEDADDKNLIVTDRLAVNASLDQNDPVTVGDVAVTLAAQGDEEVEEVEPARVGQDPESTDEHLDFDGDNK